MPVPNDAMKDLATQLEPYLSGTDSAAFHDNVAGEIAALTVKTTPATSDNLLGEDSADADAKVRITVGGVFKTPGWIAALDSATPASGDSIVLSDADDADAPKRAAISSLSLTQSQITGAVLDVAEDAAAAITSATCAIRLQSSTTGAKAITTSSSYAGQVIPIFLLARSGGSYTLALDANTLTLDAASEGGIVVRNAANSAWIVCGLSGATIV